MAKIDEKNWNIEINLSLPLSLNRFLNLQLIPFCKVLRVTVLYSSNKQS